MCYHVQSPPRESEVCGFSRLRVTGGEQTLSGDHNLQEEKHSRCFASRPFQKYILFYLIPFGGEIPFRNSLGLETQPDLYRLGQVLGGRVSLFTAEGLGGSASPE